MSNLQQLIRSSKYAVLSIRIMSSGYDQERSNLIQTRENFGTSVLIKVPVNEFCQHY